MKASELIEQLQKQILKYGDLNITRFDYDLSYKYINIDTIDVCSISNPTKEAEDAEIDVFVLE